MSESKSAADTHNEKILEVRKLLKERDDARKEGNYARSDTLRQTLIKTYNVKIVDQANGPSGFRFLDGTSNKLMQSDTKPAETTRTESSVKKRNREEAAAPVAPPDERRNDGEEPRKKVKAAVAAEQGRNATVMSSLLKSTVADNTRVVQGVTIEDVIVGTGKQAKSGNRIKVNYVGKFKTNGRVFDSSAKKPFAFRLGGGEVIRGWDIGCDGMKVGGKRMLTIPPEKAYGRVGAPPTIPPNSTLVFEVTLIDIVK